MAPPGLDGPLGTGLAAVRGQGEGVGGGGKGGTLMVRRRVSCALPGDQEAAKKGQCAVNGQRHPQGCPWENKTPS